MEEEPAAYLDILAEFPGVNLEREEREFQVVTYKPESDFAELAAAVLDNAGINPDNRIWEANNIVTDNRAPRGTPERPVIIPANEDKIVYKIMFDLLDAGLGGVLPPEAPMDTPSPAIAPPVLPGAPIVAPQEGC
jgi:hypothetical protein